MRNPMAAAALAMGLLAGCGTGTETPAPAPTGPTYWTDVKPLFDAHCVECHTAGGIGTFTIDTPEKAQTMAKSIARRTADKSMPPWQPGEDCAKYVGNTSMTDTEIDLIQKWSAGGAQIGTKGTAALHEDHSGTSTAKSPLESAVPSITADIGVDYVSASPASDDYHCFVDEHEFTKDEDLIAYKVLPGNGRIVHHVIVYEVEQSDRAKLNRKDAAEPGPGYTCFGDSNVGGNWVASWAPGQGFTKFPETTGVRIKKGSKLVLQVHYNLLNGRGLADRSKIDMHFAATPVTNQAVVLPLPQPLLSIPAGKKDHIETIGFRVDEQTQGRVWGVGGHMHLLGTSFRMLIDHQLGADTCLLTLPKYDFHWQGMYFFDAPVPVVPGDTVAIKCVFDNTPERQPVIDGVRQEPRTVTWGENTTDEMCLGLIYATK